VKTSLVAKTSILMADESLAVMRLPRLPLVVDKAPVATPTRRTWPWGALRATRTERI
jgi:hypothetical protein